MSDKSSGALTLPESDKSTRSPEDHLRNSAKPLESENISTSNLTEGGIYISKINGERINIDRIVGGDEVGRDKITVGNVENAAVAIGERNTVATKGSIAISGNVGGNLIISIGRTELAIPHLQLVVAVITLAVLLLVATILIKASQPPPTAIMTGDFNVAVAQFQVYGQGEGVEDAQKLAQGFANAIEQETDELADDINETMQIRFPRETGVIHGKTAVERAEKAWILAKEINAHVVIYGTIEVNGLAATIKPEFLVLDKDFTGAAEVTGQYRMGHEILLAKVDNRSLQNDVEDTLKTRFRALVVIIDGLSDYVVGKYQDAENKFSKVLGLKAWDNPDVIYVLLGNTALRQREWEKAEKYYSEAQNINLDYARAFVGLGSVFLAQAMTDVQSERYDFDIQLLDKSINSYQQALESRDQPPLADVSTRANFGIGEAYLRKALFDSEMGNNKASEQYYSLARQAFQSVIQDYEIGNERVQELSAHAHARLGLLYWQTRGPEAAIPEFEQAVKLLPDYGQAKGDKAAYQEILDELQ